MWVSLQLRMPVARCRKGAHLVLLLALIGLAREPTLPTLGLAHTRPLLQGPAALVRATWGGKTQSKPLLVQTRDASRVCSLHDTV